LIRCGIHLADQHGHPAIRRIFERLLSAPHSAFHCDDQ
jgi:hypothetical protein